MTKVQLRFRLERPLEGDLPARIADAHAVYGIFRIGITPNQDGLLVEYDATRMDPAQVAAALAGAGIPVTPQA
jgi:hypothetical protein